MLYDGVVEQLVRLGNLPVDKPGEVWGRVPAVTRAVQSGIKSEVNLYIYIFSEFDLSFIWNKNRKCHLGNQ